MWQWTRQIAIFWLAVRFAGLGFIVLILGWQGVFLVVVPIAIWIVIVVRSTH